jgi:sulfopyruvate decarboxylase TPP-binding subunit
MPKSRIPQVEIQFGGQTRHLIFGHHALGEMEEAAVELTDASRIKSVILALWAGLLTETLDSRGRETAKTLSRFQVASILDTMEPDEIEAIAGKIMEAQNLAKPPENPTEAAAPQN